jgi:hypothetical protein
MGRGKRYQPEQVVNLLRQIEVAIANGKAAKRASFRCWVEFWCSTCLVFPVKSASAAVRQTGQSLVLVQKVNTTVFQDRSSVAAVVQSVARRRIR